MEKSAKKIGMITLDVVDRSLIGSSAKTMWPEFPYPILFQKAEGVTFERLGKHDLSLRDPMLEAGRKLVEAGVSALTGGCGFMGLFQKDFADTFEVPPLLTSLCQIPMAALMLGKKGKIGILAANSESIDEAMLRRVGIDPTIPVHIKGLQDKPHFFEVIYKLGRIVDTNVMKREFIECAQEMIREDPAVRIVVCECTMLPVYRTAIQKAVGLPVFDWETMLDSLYTSL
ncbi:MAG: aspartate/glutamate racemase family protein [Planctomycetota bacterium]|nr:aspartate/glutamate racemase family protein [Planctomycetota bacterium]